MNILILGDGYAAGYIKSELAKNEDNCVKVITRKDVDYTCIDTLGSYIDDEFRYQEGIDVVINCSGYTGTPNIDSAEYEKDLCWKLNVTAPINVQHICRSYGIAYIHISSGCVYTGYSRVFNESDTPNFGLFDAESSFYSKSKHAFELQSAQLPGIIFRIRMPFGPDKHSRNYLSKIVSYDNLIDYVNSRTYMPDFAKAVAYVIEQLDSPKLTQRIDSQHTVFNVVNDDPLSVKEATEIMLQHGYGNPNWQFVDISKLNLAAGRSNCIVSADKIKRFGVNIRTDRECLLEALQAIK